MSDLLAEAEKLAKINDGLSCVGGSAAEATATALRALVVRVQAAEGDLDRALRVILNSASGVEIAYEASKQLRAERDAAVARTEAAEKALDPIRHLPTEGPAGPIEAIAWTSAALQSRSILAAQESKT